MFKNKKYTILTVFLLIAVISKAQYNAIVLKAMSDELNRNKENLVFKDFNKPFYIAYSYYDLNVNRYSYTLGGKCFATHEKSNNGGVRLLMGDYQVTDENFSDRTNRYKHNDGHIPLANTPNYDAIRRHFWMATNNVYKNAAETYKNKIAAMKQQNLSEDELPAPDFSKEKPTEYIIKEMPEVKNKTDLELLSKNLSEEFLAYPDIIDSNVKLIETNIYRYYINTEGTKIAVPEERIHLEIRASTYNKNNEVINDGLFFDAMNKDQLVSMDTLKSYIHTFTDKLLKKARLENWDDSYSGPVLFEDQAIYQLVLAPSFVPGKGFIALRESLIRDKKNGIYLDNKNTLEKRIGKRVASKSVSIYDIPGLENFDNIPLMGYYKIDNQGVVPPDTLTIVQSGVLESLLNSRIPIKSIQKSNGDNRTSCTDGRIQNAISPGNLFFKCSETKSKKSLKEQLMQVANEEGLDYAMIVRPAVKGCLKSPLEYFIVDLKTGKETQVNDVNSNKIDIESLKDVVAASDKEDVLNIYDRHRKNRRYYTEVPSSFIYPDALLIKDIELTGSNKPINKNAPVIPNPLSLKN